MNRMWLATLAGVMMAVGVGLSVADRFQHEQTTAHSDMRWHDLDSRLDKMAVSCRLPPAVAK